MIETEQEMLDLLLKGATILDPSQGVDGMFDLGIKDGVVAALKPEIAEAEAAKTINLAGGMVLPGLVDLHTHVYWGVVNIGAEPDELCLKQGVTTTADGGSAGSETFAGFLKWIVGTSRTRVYCFLNLSRIGLTGHHSVGELANPAYADPKGALRILHDHGEVVVGLKLRLLESATGGPSLPLLKMAREVADEAAKPIMVHI